VGVLFGVFVVFGLWWVCWFIDGYVVVGVSIFDFWFGIMFVLFFVVVFGWLLLLGWILFFEFLFDNLCYCCFVC